MAELVTTSQVPYMPKTYLSCYLYHLSSSDMAKQFTSYGEDWGLFETCFFSKRSRITCDLGILWSWQSWWRLHKFQRSSNMLILWISLVWLIWNALQRYLLKSHWKNSTCTQTRFLKEKIDWAKLEHLTFDLINIKSSRTVLFLKNSIIYFCRIQIWILLDNAR